MKPNGSATLYELNATIPPELVAPLIHMLQKSGGHAFKLTSAAEERQIVRRIGKTPARAVIINALEEAGSETYRGELRLALELNGHSPSSVGPICTMLQKEGRVFSPRRGFWQIRSAD